MNNVRTIGSEIFIDPICGMTVKRETAAGSQEYKGETYYFCSTGCQSRFQGYPESFLVSNAEKNMPKDVEYTCPMHPQVSTIGPSSCPICGMTLEPRVV